jgi:15-cis-phytoene synthase
MLRRSPEQAIFRKASTTYYWSSRFFPAGVREDVFRLYSFVRVADDLVDSIPQKKTAFRALRSAWEKAVRDPSYDTTLTLRDTMTSRVVKNMVYIHRKYHFKFSWTEAFLDAMQADLDGRSYETLDDTLAYMYGSAEVIGLMMARIMGLPKEACDTARLQGRAMQFINFLRDVAEDNELGRQYIPREDLERFGLSDLSRQTAMDNQAAFTKLMRFELSRYRKWQAEATAGYSYLPRRLRLPVKTAADMYNWTAHRIDRDPLMVFVHKIKPTKRRVVGQVLTNIVR